MWRRVENCSQLFHLLVIVLQHRERREWRAYYSVPNPWYHQFWLDAHVQAWKVPIDSVLESHRIVKSLLAQYMNDTVHNDMSNKRRSYDGAILNFNWTFVCVCMKSHCIWAWYKLLYCLTKYRDLFSCWFDSCTWERIASQRYTTPTHNLIFLS